MTSIDTKQHQKSNFSSIVKRARVSQWPAIPMSNAIKIVEKVSEMIQPESKVYPVAALQPGRILAEKIFGLQNVPNARVSVKDGYAVLSSDGDGLRQVVGFSTAGSAYTGKLNSGECVRISTGAVVPEGADAVIQIEDTVLTRFDGDTELEVNFIGSVNPGQDIREPGSDIKKGTLLLDIGYELGSAEIGILNAFGIQHVEIFRKPKVCVLSTGNELVESYQTTVPNGCIRDSNRPQLIALLREQGFKAIDAGIASDSMQAIEKALRTAAQFASVIVTSGGVSMGEKDYLKEVLENKLNFKIEFGRVWMKPGLPCTLAHGNINGNFTVVFALPGNPVSSWVCTHLFVSPFLRALGGHLNTKATVIKVKMSHSIKLGIRPEYCRGYIELRSDENLPIATVTGSQISSRQMSLVGAQVLLILPSNKDLQQINCGDIIEAMVISKI